MAEAVKNGIFFFRRREVRRDGEETAYLRRPEPERWPEEMQGKKEVRR